MFIAPSFWQTGVQKYAYSQRSSSDLKVLSVMHIFGERLGLLPFAMCLNTSYGRVVRDFEREAKTRCNF